MNCKTLFYGLAAVSALAVAACSSGPLAVAHPLPSPSVTIAASPSSFVFSLNQTAPQVVTVTRSSGSFAGLTALASDPTMIGVNVTALSGNVATVSVLPIGSNGGTPVSVQLTDSTGVATTLTVTPAVCGRPPDMDPATILLSPAPGATHVAANVGTLYFAVFSQSPHFIATANIHLVLGGTQTMEGTTPLVQATPPGGAPTPVPLPGLYEYLEAGTIPTLPTNTTVKALLYDDTCQAPTTAGSFST